MKRYFSIINLLVALVLAMMIPMFLSCFSKTQIYDGDSLLLGLPFTYYSISVINLGTNNIDFFVHFQFGVFLADVIIAYLMICFLKKTYGKN